MTASVDVLMATCNSARYLSPMLQSLVDKTFREFRLTVSDDCSTDDTLEIVEAFAPRFALTPRVIRRDRPSGSAKQNFSSLLALSESDHVFLADHDDVWRPDRIARATARLCRLEAIHEPATPILTHTDMRPVDAELQPLGHSYWAFKAIDPRYGTRLNTALMHPTVSGCAAAFNRALIDRAGAIPPEAHMHDWWLNLVAAAYGVVDFDAEPSLDYRIHASNASRPARYSVAHVITRRTDQLLRLRERVHVRIAQGAALLARADPTMPDSSRKVLEDFVSIPLRGFLGRRIMLLRGRFIVPGVARNVANVLFI